MLVLDTMMHEDHEQHDVIWQKDRVGMGRRTMKRGILAYRAAYPDLRFAVNSAACGEELAGTSGTRETEIFVQVRRHAPHVCECGFTCVFQL